MESIVGLITSDESSVTKLNLSGKSMFVHLGTEQNIRILPLELRVIFELGYGEHCLILL